MLARSLEPLLVWGGVSLFDANGFKDRRISDVKVQAGHSKEEISAYLNMMEPFFLPCEASFAAQKLSELRVLTAHRAKDGSDVELLAAAYTHRLADYPADVVDAACDAWADENKFWPTWADLKEMLDARMRGRRQIRSALLAHA